MSQSCRISHHWCLQHLPMLIRLLVTGLKVGYIPQHMRYDQLQKKYYLNPLTNPKMVALKCQRFETGCKNTGKLVQPTSTTYSPHVAHIFVCLLFLLLFHEMPLLIALIPFPPQILSHVPPVSLLRR